MRSRKLILLHAPGVGPRIYAPDAASLTDISPGYSNAVSAKAISIPKKSDKKCQMTPPAFHKQQAFPKRKLSCVNASTAVRIPLTQSFIFSLLKLKCMKIKTKVQKAIFFGLLASLLTLNLIILSGTSANATDGGGGNTCKWEQQICTDQSTREVCITDGDGNTCTCGAVTRHCE